MDQIPASDVGNRTDELPHHAARQLQLAERRLARARQELLERERLIRHHQIALDLVTLPAAKRNQLIAHAEANVRRWRESDLCSQDYILRWSRILALPPEQMARAIVSDHEGWGNALRQNSPFHGVVPE